MGAASGLSLGRVVCQGCDAHGHKLDGLKQQKGIIPEFWRPEVWSQSVRRATLALTAPLPLPAFDGSWCPLTCGCIAPISASAFTSPSSLVSGSSYSLTRTLSLNLRPSPTQNGEGNGKPFQCSCLGNPMDRGAWWATVHGVTKELDTT